MRGTNAVPMLQVDGMSAFVLLLHLRRLLPACIGQAHEQHDHLLQTTSTLPVLQVSGPPCATAAPRTSLSRSAGGGTPRRG